MIIIKKTFKFAVIGFCCVAVGFFGAQFFLSSLKKNYSTSNESVQNVQVFGENLSTKEGSQTALNDGFKKAEVVPAKNVQQLKVPFIVQAPFGNWKDTIFQNACEESSIVMAMGWLNNIQNISATEAQNKILDIVKFEDEKFGYNEDTDVFDIIRIFREHFGKENIAVKENISLKDIVEELQKGNLVLVPAFGQALGNLNYTPPGPIAHMLVVTGYDSGSKKFITNDPGTKQGAGYKYDENVLFGAIWEYPSGKGPLEAPTKEDMKKAMIVVPKN